LFLFSKKKMGNKRKGRQHAKKKKKKKSTPTPLLPILRDMFPDVHVHVAEYMRLFDFRDIHPVICVPWNGWPQVIQTKHGWVYLVDDVLSCSFSPATKTLVSGTKMIKQDISGNDVVLLQRWLRMVLHDTRDGTVKNGMLYELTVLDANQDFRELHSFRVEIQGGAVFVSHIPDLQLLVISGQKRKIWCVDYFGRKFGHTVHVSDITTCCGAYELNGRLVFKLWQRSHSGSNYFVIDFLTEEVVLPRVPDHYSPGSFHPAKRTSRKQTTFFPFQGLYLTRGPTIVRGTLAKHVLEWENAVTGEKGSFFLTTDPQEHPLSELHLSERHEFCLVTTHNLRFYRST
jgi:hypothetical protein